jgi:hypothetical protein
MDTDTGPWGIALKELNEVREQRDALAARLQRLQFAFAECIANLKDARATATDANYAAGVTYAINELRRLTGTSTGD